MTKLYAKTKGECAVSLFDFLKTWQVCPGRLIKFNSTQIKKRTGDWGNKDRIYSAGGKQVIKIYFKDTQFPLKTKLKKDFQSNKECWKSLDLPDYLV